MKNVEGWSKRSVQSFHLAREGYRTFSRYQWFVERLPDAPATVLEIGCSSGDGTKFFAEHGYQCTALDFPEVIATIQKHDDIEYVGENIDGPNAEDYRKEWFEKYDAVVMGEVLQHVIFDENVLYKIWHYLKPDGILLLSTEHENLVHGAVHYYPKKILLMMIKLLGFKLLEVSTEGQKHYIWIHAKKLK